MAVVLDLLRAIDGIACPAAAHVVATGTAFAGEAAEVTSCFNMDVAENARVPALEEPHQPPPRWRNCPRLGWIAQDHRGLAAICLNLLQHGGTRRASNHAWLSSPIMSVPRGGAFCESFRAR